MDELIAGYRGAAKLARAGAPAVLGDHDAATAPCVVPGLPRDALVDRAARAEGLAVHDVLSAGASGG